MEQFSDLLKNPAFTALSGVGITMVGGIVAQIITWKKDLSIVREKFKIEHLNTAMENLKKFLETTVINVLDLNATYEEVEKHTKEYYSKYLKENPQKIQNEVQEFKDIWPHMISTYISVRHFLREEDRNCIDRFYKETRSLDLSDSNSIELIATFRTLLSCFYLSLLTNMERISMKLGL